MGVLAALHVRGRPIARKSRRHNEENNWRPNFSKSATPPRRAPLRATHSAISRMVRRLSTCCTKDNWAALRFIRQSRRKISVPDIPPPLVLARNDVGARIVLHFEGGSLPVDCWVWIADRWSALIRREDYGLPPASPANGPMHRGDSDCSGCARGSGNQPVGQHLRLRRSTSAVSSTPRADTPRQRRGARPTSNGAVGSLRAEIGVAHNPAVEEGDLG